MDYEAYSVLHLNFLGAGEHDENLLIRERAIFFVELSYCLVDFNNECSDRY